MEICQALELYLGGDKELLEVFRWSRVTSNSHFIMTSSAADEESGAVAKGLLQLSYSKIGGLLSINQIMSSPCLLTSILHIHPPPGYSSPNTVLVFLVVLITVLNHLMYLFSGELSVSNFKMRAPSEAELCPSYHRIARLSTAPRTYLRSARKMFKE